MQAGTSESRGADFPFAMAEIEGLLLLLVLLLLPKSDSTMQSSMCTMSDPLHIQHQHYLPGDLIIGAIVSQLFGTFFPQSLFDKKPHADIPDINV